MTLADQCVKRALLFRAPQSQGRSHQHQRPGGTFAPARLVSKWNTPPPAGRAPDG